MLKKILILSLIAALVAGVIACFAGNNKKEAAPQAAYLRVHIRANSNDASDQEVKYKVRDRVVEYLTPVVSECGNKQTAMKRIGGLLQEIASVADGVLRENGYFYGARASLRQEEFPTRVYDEATLPAGVYDALILELGSGSGDNWWCVVYPPLCFAGGETGIRYKSKIMEIIQRFYAK